MTMTFGLIISNFNEGVKITPNNFADLGLKNSDAVNLTLFEDDFESGLTKWASNTGLWHMTDADSSSASPYYSFEHAMWYGQNSTGNYNTGTQTMGNLILESFGLSTVYQANLEFYQGRKGESGRDPSYVYISSNGTPWDEIYQSTTDTPTMGKKGYRHFNVCWK